MELNKNKKIYINRKETGQSCPSFLTFFIYILYLHSLLLHSLGRLSLVITRSYSRKYSTCRIFVLHIEYFILHIEYFILLVEYFILHVECAFYQMQHSENI